MLTVEKLSRINSLVLSKQGKIHDDGHQHQFDDNMAQVYDPAARMESSCSPDGLGEGRNRLGLPVLAVAEELLLGARVQAVPIGKHHVDDELCTEEEDTGL